MVTLIKPGHDAKNYLEFDSLRAPDRSKLKLTVAKPSELRQGYKLVKRDLPPPIAPFSEVKHAYLWNKYNITVLKKGGKIVGVYGLLMLNACGLEAFLLNNFNPRKIDTTLLSRTEESPVAIYEWALAAKGVGIAVIQHMSQFLQRPKLRAANIYARPITDTGIKLALARGFRPLSDIMPGFYRYQRHTRRCSNAAQVA